jgi:hypothetical protein
MGRTKSGVMRGCGRPASDVAAMARQGPFVAVAFVLAVVIGGACPSIVTAKSRREPTLGSTSSSIYTFPGIGKVAPRTVNAQGDANSVVLHIRWKHWGRAKAAGFGESYEFAPHGGYLPGLWPVELHAQDLGRCYPGGPLVYRRLARRDTRAPGHSWYHWALWPDLQYPKRQLLC